MDTGRTNDTRDVPTEADESMELIPTEIPDVQVVVPTRHEDPRGFFSETYNRERLRAVGIELQFVQDNHSMSTQRGVVRGLHYQIPPFDQDKLVRVVRGSILDVAVDIRRGSPTFGKHVCVKISRQAWNQILVPSGFAHGFCTLESDTEVIYKVTRPYAPEHERGILWNDPDLRIDWPISEAEATLSDRDRKLPRFADAADMF